jgi:hypothetical protein
VLRRLRRVYAATVQGWHHGKAVDAYFVVRHPTPSTLAELEQLARQQVALWLAIARDAGAPELATELRVHSIEFVPQLVRRSDPALDSPDVALHDVEGDWHRNLEPLFTGARATREAFYSIACNYHIARFLTWPWYRSSTMIQEPYAPAFELWCRGASLSVPAPGRVLIDLTRTLDAAISDD